MGRKGQLFFDRELVLLPVDFAAAGIKEPWAPPRGQTKLDKLLRTGDVDLPAFGRMLLTLHDAGDGSQMNDAGRLSEKRRHGIPVANIDAGLRDRSVDIDLQDAGPGSPQAPREGSTDQASRARENDGLTPHSAPLNHAAFAPRRAYPPPSLSISRSV